MMADTEQRLAALEHRVGELEDINSIRRLHWAYGYYIDFNLPEQVADLFAEDGAVVLVAVAQRQAHPGVRERLRHTEPDARHGAGNEGDAPFPRSV